jgi:drug/metabolite transporter (DMT)-like permease
MSPPRVFLLTLLAMLAFAANSLLCRAALHGSTIDAASFTTLRIAAGAATLWLIVRLRDGPNRAAGNWPSALALFGYAAAFSFAYVSLTAATGALLLFGAVLARGERLRGLQMLGLAFALSGLVGLLLPGLSAPPLPGALLMLAAGACWGVYSLRGKGAGDPLRVSAGNFLRALPFALVLSAAMLPWARLDLAGAALAVASGALASGVGYAIWYAALPALRVTTAATVQLTVPVIAALGGFALLGEPPTPRFVIAAAAILGGIALVVAPWRRRA